MDIQRLASHASPWLGLLSQDTRLIEIDSALPGALVVERFEGRESVCDDFRFEIDCLSTSAFLDAKALIAQPLSLRLRRADGGHRHWHGHCTRVAPLGSDGGLARYRLTMEPWTAFLKLRRNAIIFQDLDALGVVERIFDDYPQGSFRVDTTQALAAFPITTQYRQSDHDFVFRLLADAGLAWRFEHVQDADESSEASGSKHTLVIFDRDAEVVDASPAAVRFHRIDAAESLDAITHFTEQRQATANAVTTASWQPERVESHAASIDADPAGPQLPTREVYRAARSGRFAERRQADLVAELQLDSLRLPQRLHAGSGSARGLDAGTGFTLSQHPALSGQRFLPLTVEHVAANNLGSGIVALLDSTSTASGELERGSYRNRFIAVPADTAIVPTLRAKPTAPGLQTARVVGLSDAAVTSTRDHQVRIQFAWQRGRAPNRGGLTDTGSTANPDGHAPGDDSSGTWVRVAEWQAGPNWGSHALPRIGSEVLVEFLHGDIDQPLIVGQLYNGEVAPPFALAEASNHPGTVSGLHTQSLDGSGTQQWLLDDATGQLRQRLHTSLADSRLELGYLIDASNASRGGYQGEGFDLATLGWANVRAGQGVLLSTTARSNAASTQLDVAEAVGQLKAAERTAQALSDAAEGSEVAALAGNARQTDLIRQVDSEQDGKYDGSVNGQSATKPSGSARDGGDPVEKFAAPLLLAESSDAIAFTTPASAVAYAGGHSHLTSQSDAHLVAAQTFAGVSGGHVALFAQHGPIKAITASGPLSLQAHAGPLELLADRSVTVTATDERIDVLAKQKIVLQAGKTQITLEGGDITFACPGNFTVKAGQVPFKGGASNAATLPKLPAVLAAGLGPMLLRARVLDEPSTGQGFMEQLNAPGATPSLSLPSALPSSGPGSQYVNLKARDSRWNDGALLASLDRQTRKPKIHVEFNQPGQHSFKVRLVPDTGNVVYSATEKGRSTGYNYTMEERSYATNADGTFVVDDFELEAAGRNRYTFEISDKNGNIIQTEQVETVRRVYLQEIKMRGNVEKQAASNLNAFKKEFGNHGIEVLTSQSPTVLMPAMENVGPGADEAKLLADARSAYATSQGSKFKPYTVAVIYTDQLAAKRSAAIGPLTKSVTAGPGQGKVTLPVVDILTGKQMCLWNGIVAKDDWVAGAEFVPHLTGGARGKPVPIPRNAITHQAVKGAPAEYGLGVIVDLSKLAATVTRGELRIKVHVVDRFRAGLSFGNGNLICVCTRAWWKLNPTQNQNAVMVHEMGHKIGMVPGGQANPDYDESKLDKAKHFYDTTQGHVGNHCHAGIAPKPGRTGALNLRYDGQADGRSSSCVMYGATNGNAAFCPECVQAVRKVDISSGWAAF